MATQNKDNKEDSKQYKTFLGVRVLWPPECPDDILQGCIEETLNTLKVHNIEEKGAEIAESLKKFMDKTYEPYWHVFLGKNFGNHSIHVKNRFIYFIKDNTAFLFYQTQ